MKNLIISESEKNKILRLYDNSYKKRDFIFELCVSVDGRYVILMDDVYDNVEKKIIGNLWESIDIFKNIIKNIKLDSNKEYQIIRENIISIPLLENKTSLLDLKKILLEFDFFQDTWLGKELTSAKEGIKSTAKQGLEGLKKFGVAVSKGEWSEILNLLAKGVKFVFRKLKDALFSNAGMIVDAILVATGVGKAVQWIPWAMVTALDVYQIANDDWPDDEKNDPTWMKYLTLGFSILGLVFTGYVAKSAKASITTAAALKSPKSIGLLQRILSAIKKVPKLLGQAITYLMPSFPKAANLIKTIMSPLTWVLKKLFNIINSILSKKGLTAGVKSTALLYGVNKATDFLGNNKTPELQLALKSDNVKPDFTNIDI